MKVGKSDRELEEIPRIDESNLLRCRFRERKCIKPQVGCGRV